MRVAYDNAARETRPRDTLLFSIPLLALTGLYIYIPRFAACHAFFQELISQTSIVRLSDIFLLNGEFMPRRTRIKTIYTQTQETVILENRLNPLSTFLIRHNLR